MACRPTLLAGVVALGVAASAAAQQAPPRAELETLALVAAPRPTATRGSALDRALAARDWPRAEQLLVEEIERQPKQPALLRTLASVFLMDRKPLNAAIALKKADAIEPLDAQARFQLVLAYVAMARGEWARPELERLAKEQPASALYPYWLGRLDYDAGQYASAIARFEAALAREPALVRAWDNLGLCHEALNQPDQAMARYREAVRLNRVAVDVSPWPFLNLGILLRTRGELKEADALFREALAADDRFARAHYQLGVLLEEEGRVDDALTSLERAAALDAAYAEPHYALARIYRRRGDAARADRELATFQRLRNPGGAAPR